MAQPRSPLDAPRVPAHEDLIVPVVHEDARLETRTVETGRVHVRKTVEEREELLTRTLASDEVQVEHVAVGSLVDPNAVPCTREVDGVLIVPVLEEVLVVEKRLLLKEELHVRKHRREVHYSQPVVLKSERVVVEREGDSHSEDQSK